MIPVIGEDIEFEHALRVELEKPCPRCGMAAAVDRVEVEHLFGAKPIEMRCTECGCCRATWLADRT